MRIIVAAYLYDSLSSIGSVALRTRRHPNPSAYTQGCAIDPSISLLPDEIIFKTNHRHLDFDLYTITTDRERALQFFRWKEHMAKSGTRPTRVGDVLFGLTNNFLRNHLPLKPYFPAVEYTSDVLDHAHSIRRSNPLEADVSRRLASSNEFGIELIEDLSPQPLVGQCTIYRCRIVSIDGERLNSSGDLCVKLFDDRFLPMSTPEGVMLEHFGIPSWFFEYEHSEDTIRFEHGAYDRLEQLQGSLIPTYFGAHTVRTRTSPLYSRKFTYIVSQFTVSNGHTLGGILLEYIKAEGMDKFPVKSLAEEDQVRLVSTASRFANDWI